MRSIFHTQALAVALIVLALAGRTQASEPPANPANAPQDRATRRAELAKSLGFPALEKNVRACVDRVLAEDAAEAVLTVQALRMAGGPHAVDGLFRLTRHIDRTTRAHAWKAIAGLRLRRDEVVNAASREILILSTREESEGLAATLGVIGDARHLSVLFEVAAGEQEIQRKAAFASLRALTGVRLPDRLSHWMSWWRLRKKRGDVDLRAALDAIESQRTKNPSLQCSIVMRDAWFDIPMVRETLRRWLRVHDPRLRVRAAKLVADLRLGDLIDDLDSVGRYADGDKEREAADAALQALDVPPGTWRKHLAAKKKKLSVE